MEFLAASSAPSIVSRQGLYRETCIQGVVAEFEKTGFGQQAKSWVSTGPNLPINAEQIQQALGSEKVREMAAKFGIPVDKVADLLANRLRSLTSPPS
jgi:uncharacterized protein YidB (DUF937 family)